MGRSTRAAGQVGLARFLACVLAAGALAACSGQATPTTSSAANVLDQVEASSSIEPAAREKCAAASGLPAEVTLTATLATTVGATREAMVVRYGEDVAAGSTQSLDLATPATLCSYSTAGASEAPAPDFIVLAVMDDGNSFFATASKK